MRVALRWLGYLIAGVLVLALLAVAWIWFASSRALAEQAPVRPERLVQPAATDLAEAERRARTLGCVSCHGEGLTGKPIIDDPKVARRFISLGVDSITTNRPAWLREQLRLSSP